VAEAELTRAIYGASLVLHNVFAGLPLGISCFLLIYSTFSKESEIFEKTSKVLFNAFVCSVMLSASSGFALELEFRRYWPDMDAVLVNWNEHWGHKIAVLSFFFTTGLILACYSCKWYHNRYKMLTLCLLLIPSAWAFSGWSILLNTVMQSPTNVSLIDGKIFVDSYFKVFFNAHHLSRQTHIVATSLLKSTILVALIFAFIDKELFVKNKQMCLAVIFSTLLSQPIIGHLQVKNISKLQPAKFAAMEGLMHEHQLNKWNLLIYQPKYADSLTAIGINLDVSNLTSSRIIPLNSLDEKLRPSVFLNFYAFRIMILSYIIIFFLFILAYRWWVGSLLVGMLFFVEIAENAGWMLSEAGRQPWLFQDLVLRTPQNHVAYTGWSLVLLLTTFFSFSLLSWFCLKKLKTEFEKDAATYA
jgi:cytochrome bd ubiquinol oxidase subunit I